MLTCDPVQAAVDRDTSILAASPRGLHRRFRGIPLDPEIVRCVEQRVGFPFAAGIATDPSEAIEPD